MRARRIERARRGLLSWYDSHARDLPWRRHPPDGPDPYAVWVSEVMLQQTRVGAVEAYYDRWLSRFPTVSALAEAPLDAVLKEWEGLGYYSRAKNLHRAAQQLVRGHAGRIPDDPTSLRSLPGVGPYTVGAVLSIAYGREEPAVDGNVRRVFARWLNQPDPKDATLWKLAGALVRGPRPGDLNQALMDLGSTVCTPRRPLCAACPVLEVCGAAASGTQETRPRPRRSKPLPLELHGVAIVERRGRLLLARRPLGSRLGGLWEFPAASRIGQESDEGAAERAVRDGLGLRVRVEKPLGIVNHAFTHVRVRYAAFRSVVVGGEERAGTYPEWAWLTLAELDERALPRAQRRLAKLVAPPS